MRMSGIYILFIIGIALPSFQLVFSFIGGILVNMISVLIPVVIYLRIQDVHFSHKILLYLIFLVSMVLSCLTFVFKIFDIKDLYSLSHHHH